MIAAMDGASTVKWMPSSYARSTSGWHAHVLSAFPWFCDLQALPLSSPKDWGHAVLAQKRGGGDPTAVFRLYAMRWRPEPCKEPCKRDVEAANADGLASPTLNYCQLEK